MKIKKAAPRTEDSGLRGAASKGMVASFFQTQPCLLPSSAAPPHSSPRPPLAGLRCPHRPKREKAGRERECGAQLVRPVSLPPAPGVRLPGLAQIGAGDPGEAPWFFLEYPARSETWGEGSNRAQGCPPPNPLFFLLPEALGRKPGCICWETCRDWEPVCAPQACKAERAAFGKGKQKSGSVESLSRGTGKQGRVGAGGGGKQSRCCE